MACFDVEQGFNWPSKSSYFPLRRFWRPTHGRITVRPITDG